MLGAAYFRNSSPCPSRPYTKMKMKRRLPTVTPAKAGVHRPTPIPACAGMTVGSYFCNDGLGAAYFHNNYKLRPETSSLNSYGW